MQRFSCLALVEPGSAESVQRAHLCAVTCAPGSAEIQVHERKCICSGIWATEILVLSVGHCHLYLEYGQRCVVNTVLSFRQRRSCLIGVECPLPNLRMLQVGNEGQLAGGHMR